MSLRRRILGDGFIRSCDANLRIDQQNDDIGIGNGDHGLLDDFGDEGGAALGQRRFVARASWLVDFYAAGVNDLEGGCIPKRLAMQAVAGGAGHLVRYRQALADQPVEERALADIGSSYERDDGFAWHWRGLLR